LREHKRGNYPTFDAGVNYARGMVEPADTAMTTVTKKAADSVLGSWETYCVLSFVESEFSFIIDILILINFVSQVHYQPGHQICMSITDVMRALFNHHRFYGRLKRLDPDPIYADASANSGP